MTCKFSQNTDMESGGDNVGVSFEWFSRLRIPDSDCLIPRARDDALPIRRECDGGDPGGVSFERPCNEFTRLHIPDSNCPVIRSRQNVSPIGRECDRGDAVRVSCERL